MKMVVGMRIGKKVIATVELEGVDRTSKGLTVYWVSVARKEARVEFRVKHRRSDGPFRLMELVSRKARRMFDEYYSYPEEKVEGGLLRDSDMPGRYKKEFAKFFGVGTVALLPRKPVPEGCVDLDFGKPAEEMAYNVGDVERFLENRRYGAVAVWY